MENFSITKTHRKTQRKEKEISYVPNWNVTLAPVQIGQHLHNLTVYCKCSARACKATEGSIPATVYSLKSDHSPSFWRKKIPSSLKWLANYTDTEIMYMLGVHDG